jgi:isopentenyldiphosphate isomerase
VGDRNFVGEVLSNKPFEKGDLVLLVYNKINMKLKIIIVDKDDNEIGLKERKDKVQGDIHRVSALWLRNSKGEFLLAQRSFSKPRNAGKWGPAVEGTVEEGENYFNNIVKETEEEIGIKDIEFTEGPKIFSDRKGGKNHFKQFYTAVLDKSENDFVVQKEEVESVKWFTRDELKKEISKNPEMFLEKMSDYLLMFENE